MHTPDLYHFSLLHVHCQPHEGYPVIGLKSYTVLLHDNILFCTMELTSGASVNRAIVWSALPKGFTPHLSLAVHGRSHIGLAFQCCSQNHYGGQGQEKALYSGSGCFRTLQDKSHVFFFTSFIVKWHSSSLQSD